MKTLTTLLVGMAIGAFGVAGIAAVPVGPADDATKAAVQEVKRGIVAGHKIAEGQYDLIAVRRWGNIAVATGRGNLVYRNADGSRRVSNYYSFNVFEQRDGRWVYSAAFLP